MEVSIPQVPHLLLCSSILHTMRTYSAPVEPYAHVVPSLQALFRLVSLFFQLVQMEGSTVGVSHGPACATMWLPFVESLQQLLAVFGNMYLICSCWWISLRPHEPLSQTVPETWEA